MSIEVITVLLFSCLVIAIAAGIPLAFSLGGTAVIFAFFIWGPSSLYMFPNSARGTMENIILIAIPLFIFMGNVLEKSGIAEDLYAFMYHLFSGIKGGLAAGTVAICTIFAAMSGVSAAATVTMGLIALPSMLRRNYDKHIAAGCIMAGGALGVLIPPSVTMIVYAMVSGESVGRLFLGGVVPGLLLSSMFVLYILVRCQIQPHLGPAVPREERLPLRTVIPSFTGLTFSVLIIVGVLGAIFTGIATPTEAAAVGAFLSSIAALLKRSLSSAFFGDVLTRTLELTVMCLWIVVAANWFASVYHAIGAPALMREIVDSLRVNRWIILIITQLTFLVLGCFMDPIGIIMIAGPIFVPVIKDLGFNPLWFGVVFVVNMEMALLTPPFGVNLFYLKGVSPPGISMADLYRSIGPFVGIQMLCLLLIIIFPQLVLFLPGLMR